MPFKELSVDELIQINKNRVELTFKKGETIIKQGALAAHIVYIKSGLVKVYREHGTEELVLSLESKGKMIGLQALFSQGIYPYSVTAYDDVSVCLLDLNAVKSLLSENAMFASQLLNLLNEETLFSYNRMACLTLKQLHGRFADLLLCLSLRIYKRKEFSVPLSKKDMAAIMNMSQESLSRVIKDFTVEKIVDLKGNRISILNFEKIRHLSLVG
ncbi:Crp/Fnr family transcriptional regulator [Maribellus sp. CM-23]|uniref:Crp/Fnr family transcriptional regulator n=1 Tax=Maribellus sp. CM-23 TaxID=2781026 RepID=UPI001F1C2019|nr:Crp/Fnr family transcriptional regulator [Maribellus sp. CM-23]MCE4563619.1 Crp/Fnr family transcriptional regulator [Maribellus sp. CM-23]